MEKSLETKIQKLFKIMNKKNLKLGACESYTGGGFGNVITNVQHSSSVFVGSLVTYSNEAKQRIAKVKERIIKKYGAVSRECADAMAINTLKVLHCDVAISFTGNADKDVMEGKTPFCGFISIDYLAKLASYKLDLSEEKGMTREKFKMRSIEFGIDKILQLIK